MKHFFPIFLLLLFTASCNYFDSEEYDTQFVHIRSAKFKSSNSSGFNNGQIPDLHVLVEGTTTSLMRIPQTMPFIPQSDISNLIIIPAVPMDGNKSNTKSYPVMKLIEKEISKNINGTDTLDLIVDYKTDVVFDIREGFEHSNIMNFNLDENNNTILTRTKDEAFEGIYSGQLHLTKEEPIIHVGSDGFFNIASVKEGIFLELSYKSEIELFVGLAAINDDGEYVRKYKLYLTPKSEWNTVYVDLTNDYFSSGSEQVKLILGAEMDTNLLESANIYIDNIKVMYY